MSEDNTAAFDAAERACQALQALAYAVAPGELNGPSEVYAVLGALMEAAAVLGAVTDRLAAFLDVELQSDRIGVDLPMSGPAPLPDPLAEVARATAALTEGRRHAEQLATALDAAHETTSRMHRRG